MKTLSKLGPTVALMMVLASHASAGQLETPPCSPPEPGQTSTPPCEMHLNSSDMNTPAGTSMANMGKPTATNETSLTRIVADVLLNFLPLF
jgi:hypothetical protein